MVGCGEIGEGLGKNDKNEPNCSIPGFKWYLKQHRHSWRGLGSPDYPGQHQLPSPITKLLTS